MLPLPRKIPKGASTSSLLSPLKSSTKEKCVILRHIRPGFDDGHDRGLKCAVAVTEQDIEADRIGGARSGERGNC